jgi:hypothetical protein
VTETSPFKEIMVGFASSADVQRQGWNNKDDPDQVILP